MIIKLLDQFDQVDNWTLLAMGWLIVILERNDIVDPWMYLISTPIFLFSALISFRIIYKLLRK